ncbi:MAG: murein hydrolase activator EnvC [Clostridiaceae bacterium]
MNKRIKIVIITIIILNLFTTGVLATDLEDAHNQSSEIKQQITDGKNKLDDIKKNKDDIDSQINSLDKEFEQAQLEVDKLNTQINNVEEEKRSLDEKLDTLQNQLEKLKDIINKRFRKMYINSGDAYIELLFNSKNISDLIDRLEIIRTISNQDKKLTNEFKDKQDELTLALNRVENLKKELSASKEIYDTKLAELTTFKEEKTALLDKLESDESAQEAMLLKQEEEFEAVNNRILAMQAQQNTNNQNSGQEGASHPPVSDGNYYSITGGARYPITSPYEPSRISPISGKVEKHLAIDIGAPGGSGVYALKAGTVEYAGWMTGYGNVVIINHGDMSTLYAHNASLQVSVGQSVKGGQQISVVGSTGWSTGNHIHFEVIINGVKVDPALYYI